MKQLPTMRQMYWVAAFAVVMALMTSGGGLAFTAGYIVGISVFLAIIITVFKILYAGGTRLLEDSATDGGHPPEH